jgi:hypothetical protein
MAEKRNVVLEYHFRGSPPDFLGAFGTPCQVTHADVAIKPGADLLDTREILQHEGFEMQGTELLESHNKSDRLDPVWREVWSKDQAAVETEQKPPQPLGGNLHSLSPRAQKAVETAKARDTSYRASLARTGDKAIVRRPRLIGYKTRQLFAQAMAANLPQFTFNQQRDWWEAPLDQLPAAYEEFKDFHANVSDGAREYLQEAGHAV